MELLRQESDEQHPLTTSQICEYMEKYDIPCERRTRIMSEAHNFVNYRVDRMESVEVVDEDISEKTVSLRRKVRRYTETAVKMYGGPMERVTLEFDSALIGAVYDRFGEKVTMKPLGEERVVATVKVQITPTFWGWLFQFGTKMKVISPQDVMNEYKKRVGEMIEMMSSVP